VNNSNENEKINGQIVSIMPEALGLYHLPKKDHIDFKEKILLIDKTADVNKRRVDGIQKERLRHISNNRKQNIFRDFPDLANLKKIIEKYALNYFWETGYDCSEVVITDAWMNIGSKNATLQAHLHSNSYLSGNYFVNFDRNIHSLLNFYNDRLMNGTGRQPFISIPPRNKKTIYNIRDVALGVNEGDIIFWRSHLLHGFSKPNQGDKRITLSFNIMPKICHSGDQYSFVVADEV
tara:strand:+ start:875 stop:1579 length:705 start_codon:yes stop_codon:yes gene_type:complete